MKATSAQVLLKGIWEAAPADLTITDVITDSRDVVPNCAFVAINGERVDGHNFARDVYQRGAAVIVAQHPIEGVPLEYTALVKDPLPAMIRMGANYRKLFSPIVLGVTGSVGKTTTKEFCAAVFSAFGQTLKNEGNQNNEIGLPKTLFRMDDETRYAILEMGMQALGEIHELTMAALPDAAIITKIGTSHMEHLGSQENILKAKSEICDALPFGAPLALNGDDEMLRTAKFPSSARPIYVGIDNQDSEILAMNIRQSADATLFDILDKKFGCFPASIPTMGKHNVQNALLAFAAATRLGLAPEQAAKALSGYKSAGMRQAITRVDKVTIIEDCYNASPESVQAALETLKEMPIAGRRIAVLGDMLELGASAEAAHRALGQMCKSMRVDLLITVGELGALIAEEAMAGRVNTMTCTSNEQAAEVLQQEAVAGDAILLKASRGMRFEEILKLFEQKRHA